jgi:hypothetical protein
MNPKFTARLSVHADITVTYECDAAATTKRPRGSDDGPAAAGSQDVINIANQGVPEPIGPPATAAPPSDGADMPVGVDEATTPDHPDATEPSTPEAEKDVDRLVAMLKNSLITREGEAWCRLPTDDGHDGIAVPLRDRKLQSALVYVFHQKYGRDPRPIQVNTAIQRVWGEQLSRMREGTTLLECPTWRCFQQLVLNEPSGANSAEEIRTKLIALAVTEKLLKGKESLPQTPDAMGVWLTRHRLSMPHYGVELTRPTRLAKKRLWAWQTIEPDDTSDTSLIDPSVREAQQIKDVSNAPDTMSQDETNTLVGEFVDVTSQ